MPRRRLPRLKPFWTTSDGKAVKLYQGDVIKVLRRLPEKSVQMVMTSPPYWGLRDYGTAEWEGGDPECRHMAGRTGRNDVDRKYPGSVGKGLEQIKESRWTCYKCGARRIDQQIGSEKTPEEYVAKMVEVFREVRRVLRDDGTVWLNLGDSYGGRGNLVGIPWRVALALQADGWILRQDIIWAKPSPMPEPVKNRCTKAHEYLFLLAKSSKYFYDADTIRESGARFSWNVQKFKCGDKTRHHKSSVGVETLDYSFGRNKRSVWTIAPYGYSGAHFATFPPALVLPCVLAGTSEMGACSRCGAPRRRVTKEKKLKRKRPNDYIKRVGAEGTGNVCANTVAGVSVETVGWESTCDCGIAQSVPCVVLDPFVGSGTVCCVAVAKGRRSVGIDLSEEYLRDQAVPRINGTLLDRPSLARLISE